jgi:PBP1b-binding outer membrane lipoprotein LpoB
MKYNFILIIIFFISSCDLKLKKEIEIDEIVSNEMKTFNWNDVDQFPRFQNCDTISNKKLNFNCFVTTISANLENSLKNNNVVMNKSINDTLFIDFNVKKNGVILIQSISNSSLDRKIISLVDSIFTESLLKLPKLYPAIKRGQPVSSKYKLPILVSTDN